MSRKTPTKPAIVTRIFEALTANGWDVSEPYNSLSEEGNDWQILASGENGIRLTIDTRNEHVQSVMAEAYFEEFGRDETFGYEGRVAYEAEVEARHDGVDFWGQIYWTDAKEAFAGFLGGGRSDDYSGKYERNI